MDPGLAFSALPTAPVVTPSAVILAGGWLPQAIPLAALSEGQLVGFAADQGLSVDQRVQLLTLAGRVDQALTLANRVARPLNREGRLELQLARWAAEEQQRLGLPTPIGGVILVGQDAPVRWREAIDALGDVRQELAMLAWPRWAGPVVMVVGNQPFPGLPEGDTAVVRAALPLVRMGSPTPAGTTRRQLLIERLARLAIDRSVPPAGGWPTWIRRGIPQAIAGYREGGLPPADTLVRLRTAAGSVAIHEALRATGEPDGLTLPLATPWLPTGQRQRLAGLLDSVRAGVPIESALRLAGARSAEDLAAGR